MKIVVMMIFAALFKDYISQSFSHCSLYRLRL